MYEKWIDTISATALFCDIDKKDLKFMIDCIKPRMAKFSKNDYIVHAGERFEGVGVLLSGSATVLKENAAGERFIMTLLEPGDLFGEIAVFSNLTSWPSTVQAQEDCTTLFVSGDKIVGSCRNACMGHKKLILNMLEIVSEKALNLNKKVEYLTIRSMRGKISAFLLEQYKKTGKSTFMLPMNRNELAEFLNVSRPSMSREMSRMKEEGTIDYYLSSIQIKDVESLKKMVD